MRVRAILQRGEWTTYQIVSDETGETIGQAENQLNLVVQCQARGWSWSTRRNAGRSRPRAAQKRRRNRISAPAASHATRDRR